MFDISEKLRIWVLYVISGRICYILAALINSILASVVLALLVLSKVNDKLRLSYFHVLCVENMKITSFLRILIQLAIVDGV